MTGLQLVDDLSEIEASSGYDLGVLKKPKASRAIEGYDQFSEPVRHQAAVMSEYFEIF